MALHGRGRDGVRVDGVRRRLALAPNAGLDGAMSLLFSVAAQAAILLVPLHLALVWLGGDRMMRFIALTASLALLMALVAGEVTVLVADGHLLIPGLGQSPLGDHLPAGGCGVVFFTYAAVLALFGRGRVAAAAALLGLLVAWLQAPLDASLLRGVAVSAGIGFGAALAAAWAMTQVGVGVLGRLERLGEAAAGLVGRGLRRS